MDKINVTKRLIGREDINWDINGTGETSSYQNAQGQYFTLNKVNATHIPISLVLRNKLGRINVDSAFEEVLTRIQSVQQQGALEEDKEIVFSSGKTIAELNADIGNVFKNLGGHTLTITFPEGVTRSLATPIMIDGFYNGTIRLVGNKNILKDEVEMDGLFVAKGCHANVEIEDFTLNHTLSKYGVSALDSSCVNCNRCVFLSNGADTQYSALYESSNGYFNECTLSGDQDAVVRSVLADSLNTTMAKVQETLDKTLADLNDYGIGDSLKLATDVGVDANQLTETATYYYDKSIVSSNFPKWNNTKYSGIISIWKFDGEIAGIEHKIIYQRFVSEKGATTTRVCVDDLWGKWLTADKVDYTAGITFPDREDYEVEDNGFLVVKPNGVRGGYVVTINGIDVLQGKTNDDGYAYSMSCPVAVGDVVYYKSAYASGAITATIYPYVAKELEEADND